jgi:DNA mismatch repair protein MutS
LCSIQFNKRVIGVSFLDISTGEFLMTEGSREYVEN